MKPVELKPDELNLMRLLMTHDMTCVVGQLAVAAQRCPKDRSLFEDPRRVRDLMVAAIAFTVQLALDQTPRDPAELRALESELIAKLDAP